MVTPPAMLNHGTGAAAFRGFALGLVGAPVLRGLKAASEGEQQLPQVDEHPGQLDALHSLSSRLCLSLGTRDLEAAPAAPSSRPEPSDQDPPPVLGPSGGRDRKSKPVRCQFPLVPGVVM